MAALGRSLAPVSVIRLSCCSGMQGRDRHLRPRRPLRRSVGLFGYSSVLPLRDDDAARHGELVMDEQIKAAAVLVRPDAANLAPERFLVPVRAGLGDDVGDVRWLVHVGLLGWFGLRQRAATLAFAENGGVQAECGFAGARNATRSARLQRNRVCRSGWKPLVARSGELTPKPCRVGG